MIPALDLPRALFARNAIAALPEELDVLGIRRPLIVTDRGVVRAGLSARVIAAIGNYASVPIFDGVTENNVFADADGGAALYSREKCDGVIALGGGSVIDASKCIALLAANPGSIADYAGKPDVRIIGAAPIVAIPTTAGTGSDADMHAGIHPDSTSKSMGVSSNHLKPRVAILDPELTISLPPRLTAATGIDALSHCVESYMSRGDVPLAKAIALEGAGKAMRYIRRAVADGTDIEARSEMLLAAFAGGVALSMGAGPAHAIALTCSEQGFQHGILSGIGMVATLDSVAGHQPERAARLADAMGISRSASLSRTVAELMRELGLPASLGELGYEVKDLSVIAQEAHASFCNLSAFHHPSVAEYAAMISASLAAATASTTQRDSRK
jgi:4-hydroxybutyrate dehydrogenase